MATISDLEPERCTQELWHTLLRIMHDFRAGIGAEGEMNLSFPQTILLLELHGGGRMSMGELSQRLRISKGATTRMVDLLLEKGLVERGRSEADRRMVMVSPSARGGEMARRIEQANRRKVGEALTAVPQEERASLLDLLKALQRQYEEEEAEQNRHERAPLPSARW